MTSALAFDRYCRAVRDASVSFVLTRRSEADWALEFFRGRQVSVQMGSDGGASIADGVNRPDAYLVMLRYRHSRARIKMNGLPVADHDLVVIPAGQHFVFAADGPRSWISIAIPVRLLGPTILSNLSGSRDQIGRIPSVIRGTAALHRRFVQLADEVRLSAGANSASDTIGDVDARLTGCCRALISHLERTEPCNGDQLHKEALSIVKRALRNLHSESLTDRWLVEDLAFTADVGSRTLLRAFHTIIDMPPKQYLQLRQLNLIRLGLLSSATKLTVTDIMSSVGASEFGRVAGQYKKLFGELPSETATIAASMASHIPRDTTHLSCSPSEPM